MALSGERMHRRENALFIRGRRHVGVQGPTIVASNDNAETAEDRPTRRAGDTGHVDRRLQTC